MLHTITHSIKDILTSFLIVFIYIVLVCIHCIFFVVEFNIETVTTDDR